MEQPPSFVAQGESSWCVNCVDLSMGSTSHHMLGLGNLAILFRILE